MLGSPARISRAREDPTVMVGPSEVIHRKMEAEVAEDSIRMAGRISRTESLDTVRFMLPEVPAISMEVQEEPTDRLLMVVILRAASEAVGRVAPPEVAEEEGEAGVVVVADRVTSMVAPAEVADPFSPHLL
jgi:hypothetical protein